MMLRCLLAAAAISVLCIGTGCGKKQQEQVTETAPPAVAESKDTADVFDEFYSDARESEKKAAPTFSMNEPAAYAPKYVQKGAYVVQVATMVSRWLADEMATELKEKGFPAYVSEVQNPRNDLQGTYYRVRIGRFATIPDAKAFGENVLKPARYNFWVDRKSNDGAPSENRQTTYTPPPQPAPSVAPVPAPAPAPAPEPESAPAATTPAVPGNGWNADENTW